MGTFNEAFLKRAIALANNNVESGNGGPFGAVVVKDGAIIAEGTNVVTTCNDPTMHAEVNAIRKACQKLKSFQLEGCDIYSSCEPCPMCLGAIYWARPEKVFFAADKEDASRAGFDDSFIYKEINMDPASRSIPFLHCDNENAIQPFSSWQKSAQKTEY